MTERSWWEFFYFRCGIYRVTTDAALYLTICMGIFTHPALLWEFLHSFFFHTKRIQYSKKSRYHKLDLIDLKNGKSSETSSSNTTTILIFVHGGSWGSGRLTHYYLPTKRFGEVIDASYAVTLGYPVYPYGTIQQQAEAVLEGLDYLQKQSILKEFFTEKKATTRIILSGHSSGANITLLAIAKLLLAKQTIPIDAYFGLSGPYDLVAHYPYKLEHKNLHLSPMKTAAGGQENMEENSPAIILLKNADVIRTIKFPYIGLLHGLTDTIVPDYQTTRLVEQLTPILKERVKSVLPKDYGHMDPIIHLFSHQPDATKAALSELYLDFLNKLHITNK